MLQPGQITAHFGQARVRVPMHSHRESLLIVGLRGAATITTSDREWPLPSRSVLWIAAGAPHQVHTGVDHHSLVLSFPPKLVDRATGWVEASAFVHDLVRRVGDASDPARRERLTAVLVDELAAPAAPSARLSRLGALVQQEPRATVAELARRLGMSERAFRRWSQAELGMSFTRWHRERIVECALERLERGDSVKRVAAELGYASPSAFIAMFKRVTGTPPRRYRRSG